MRISAVSTILVLSGEFKKNLFFKTNSTVQLLVFQANPLLIPELLHDCYRGNETIPFNANTIQIFIDLVKKIESSYANGIEIQDLSVRLFHE